MREEDLELMRELGWEGEWVRMLEYVLEHELELRLGPMLKETELEHQLVLELHRSVLRMELEMESMWMEKVTGPRLETMLEKVTEPELGLHWARAMVPRMEMELDQWLVCH